MIKHEDKHQRVNVFINKTLRGALLETERTLQSDLQTHRSIIQSVWQNHTENEARLEKLIKQSAPSGGSFLRSTFAFFFFFHPFQLPDFKLVNWLRNLGFSNNLPGVHDIKRPVRAAEAPFIRQPRQNQDVEEHGSESKLLQLRIFSL